MIDTEIEKFAQEQKGISASNFQIFSNQISSILHKYDVIDELTGEKFNLFKILKVESTEVLHSAFIGELLNPKGSHGQRDAFLKLFVDMFCKENPICTETSSVLIEKRLGGINGSSTEGGRLDILISDHLDNQICIENKIYAVDQENQIVRYYNALRRGTLVYLTLDGNEPNTRSKGELLQGVHFKCCSYRNDILKWLEGCRKEVAIRPIIRETITQYINIVKHLTNQASNQTMNKEISEAIRKNWEASFAVAQNLDRAKTNEVNEFVADLRRTLEQYDLVCHSDISFQSRKAYAGISIFRQEWRHIKIKFEFQGANFGLIYGVCLSESQEYPISDELRAKLNSITNERQVTTGWPWFNKFEAPLDDWRKPEAFKAITTGAMKEAMMSKIEFLLDKISEIDGL